MKTSNASFTETPTTNVVMPATAGTAPSAVRLGQYLYSGPVSGVTLADGQEIMLFPGKEVELPAEHEYTQTLLALQYLAPAQEPAKAKAARITSDDASTEKGA
ncbi:MULTISPECIES: hypothetical protein [Chromobacterium]|nr:MULTISPECIES: hypothetical protein [Chromobacterium]WSE90175.1 hypothetical protein U6115_14895 [Chromobacterium subtsugae]WVH58547.1 hypothetical protein U6151_14920 [Chromobacterium subtsugae]